MMVEFNDSEIDKIFGKEAAEDETDDRLKEMFFRNRAYDNINNDMSLRIVVGHKGIGKSALLRMSYLSDIDNNELAIWLRPDDIFEVDTDSDNFIGKISNWKSGINSIIFKKSLEELTIKGDGEHFVGEKSAKKLMLKLYEAISNLTKADISDDKKLTINRFLNNRVVKIYI